MRTHRPFASAPSLAQLVCRPALPQDTSAILELTRQIWNGHDYIPFVWQDWLADSEGFLTVAEYGQHIVGMGKLTRLDQGEWWLEGLRVHPAFEGRGFATHIHRYLMERWQERDKGVIRLATASKRLAVHRICHKLGFYKIAEFSAYAKPTSPAEETPPFTLIQGDEMEAAFATLLSSPLLPLCYNLIDLGWQWANPRPSYLQQMIAARQVYWWREKEGILGIAKDEEEQGKRLMLRWAACQPQALNNLLEDFAQLSAKEGYPEAAWIAPLQAPILQALANAGYQAEWDFSLYIFEYRSEGPAA